MENFLHKKDLRPKVQAGFSDESTKKFLYNPQPRPRFVFPHYSNDEDTNKRGSTFGGGAASGYLKFRESKLSEQAPNEVSQLFHGLSFYFNGRSGDKQTMHLKCAVSKHGGRTTPFMSMRGVTHVIAENLSAVKTEKAMKSLKMKVVHPDWLICCMKEGKLLPDAPFRVVRSQKLGMGDFFACSSSSSTPASSPRRGYDGQRRVSQKENETTETSRQHHSPRATLSMVSGTKSSGRCGEKRTGSSARGGGAKKRRVDEGVAAQVLAPRPQSRSESDNDGGKKNDVNRRTCSSSSNYGSTSCERKIGHSPSDSSHSNRNLPCIRSSGMLDRTGLETREPDARKKTSRRTKATCLSGSRENAQRHV